MAVADATDDQSLITQTPGKPAPDEPSRSGYPRDRHRSDSGAIGNERIYPPRPIVDLGEQLQRHRHDRPRAQQSPGDLPGTEARGQLLGNSVRERLSSERRIVDWRLEGRDNPVQ